VLNETCRTQGKIMKMRRAAFILSVGFVAAALSIAAGAAADDPAAPAPISCSNGIPGGVNCVRSKKDEKEARNAYARGLKLEKQEQFNEAFEQFDRAVRLDPQNLQFFQTRELAKAGLVYEHVERGNLLLHGEERARAAEEFQAALDLDPGDQFARQRLEDSAHAPRQELLRAATTVGDSEEIHLQPTKERASFQFRGDVRAMFSQLASNYGMTVEFDDSVTSQQVRFYVDDVDFETALKLACEVSKSMWTALGARQFFVAKDTTENHKQFDRMSLQTFILPPHSTTTEVQDIVNTLKNVLEARFVTNPGATTDIIEVRAPQPILAACAKLMAQLTGDRPEVMLDIDVYEISHQLTQNIGVHVPNTFNLYNIPAAALAGLGGQNISQLINQLISSGGINQANGTAISSLLAQLGSQGNSIFSNPLATFGGGLTFMGLSLDQLAANLSVNESWVRSLEHLTMRAADGGDAAKFHLGTRYPILNASYAPIYNSPAIASVIGNNSYQAPFPSVSYEDLGLNVQVKPAIHGDGEVSLQLELQVRSLTGQSSNGVPVISNQEYKGSINLKDGEPAAVAGEVTLTEQRSLSGVPGFGFLPGLNQIAAENTRDDEQDELIIVVTPHVLANHDRVSSEIWVSGK
jgi:general secretion pathway protein D